MSARKPKKGPKKPPHQWVSDGHGGGHRGEYYFTCKVCGASDWVSLHHYDEGPSPGECPGKEVK